MTQKFAAARFGLKWFHVVIFFDIPKHFCLCRYNIMLSCWSHDPLKRPPFRKLVERTEMLLSENTKNVSEYSTFTV